MGPAAVCCVHQMCLAICAGDPVGGAGKTKTNTESEFAITLWVLMRVLHAIFFVPSSMELSRFNYPTIQ